MITIIQAVHPKRHHLTIFWDRQDYNSSKEGELYHNVYNVLKSGLQVIENESPYGRNLIDIDCQPEGIVKDDLFWFEVQINLLSSGYQTEFQTLVDYFYDNLKELIESIKELYPEVKFDDGSVLYS